MPDNSSQNASRLERILAAMIAAVIMLSLVCFVALFIGQVSGADFRTGVWPAVAAVPYFGLPLGFVLIVVVMIVGARRRSQAAKDARK